MSLFFDVHGGMKFQDTKQGDRGFAIRINSHGALYAMHCDLRGKSPLRTGVLYSERRQSLTFSALAKVLPLRDALIVNPISRIAPAQPATLITTIAECRASGRSRNDSPGRGSFDLHDSATTRNRAIFRPSGSELRRDGGFPPSDRRPAIGQDRSRASSCRCRSVCRHETAWRRHGEDR
jgi:hypothetical protein